MKVFILKEEYDYEGSYIRGVYIHESTAQDLADVKNRRLEGLCYNSIHWYVSEHDVDET